MTEDHGYKAVQNASLGEAVRKLVEKNANQEPQEDPKPTKIFMNTGVKKDPK